MLNPRGIGAAISSSDRAKGGANRVAKPTNNDGHRRLRAHVHEDRYHDDQQNHERTDRHVPEPLKFHGTPPDRSHASRLEVRRQDPRPRGSSLQGRPLQHLRAPEDRVRARRERIVPSTISLLVRMPSKAASVAADSHDLGASMSRISPASLS